MLLVCSIYMLCRRNTLNVLILFYLQSFENRHILTNQFKKRLNFNTMQFATAFVIKCMNANKMLISTSKQIMKKVILVFFTVLAKYYTTFPKCLQFNYQRNKQRQLQLHNYTIMYLVCVAYFYIYCIVKRLFVLQAKRTFVCVGRDIAIVQ